jgi:hypothetical protein
MGGSGSGRHYHSGKNTRGDYPSAGYQDGRLRQRTTELEQKCDLRLPPTRCAHTASRQASDRWMLRRLHVLAKRPGVRHHRLAQGIGSSRSDLPSMRRPRPELAKRGMCGPAGVDTMQLRRETSLVCLSNTSVWPTCSRSLRRRRICLSALSPARL